MRIINAGLMNGGMRNAGMQNDGLMKCTTGNLRTIYAQTMDRLHANYGQTAGKLRARPDRLRGWWRNWQKGVKATALNAVVVMVADGRWWGHGDGMGWPD